ncbi:MAG: M28 family peptidase [Bacteroidota bacterium]
MKYFTLFILIFFFVKTYSQELPKTNPLISKMVSEISVEKIEANIRTLVKFGTRHTLSDTTSDTRGIGAARRWIKSQFESYIPSSNGRLSVEYVSGVVPKSNRIPHTTQIVDVIATLKPGKPDGTNQIFIVSGHYDSRATDAMDSTSDAPGADDDGSGTALVLELARVMSKYEFRSTIVFAAFAGEEQGLFGSTILAETAKAHGWNIGGVLNNDIVGNIQDGNNTIESTYVRCFSEAYNGLDTGSVFRQRNMLGLENDGPSRILSRYVKEKGENYVPDLPVHLIFRRDRFLRGGDQTPFHDRGFAAVRMTEAKENFDRQHQNVREDKGKKYGDVPEGVNYNYCAHIAQINTATIATLSLAPVPPSNPKIMTKELAYDTELHWNQNTEKDLAAYIVRYRATDTPYWQHAVVCHDTTITLPISKDDYLFGIQAVDKDGNMSLVVIPRPGR